MEQRQWSNGGVKQWGDGNDAVEGRAMAPLHRGVKGDKVSPFVNHALASQGYKAQRTSCATTLYIGDCEAS